MTAELAQAIFFIIWGAGLVVWVLGLRRSVAFLRREDEFGDVWGSPAAGREHVDPGKVTGEREAEASAQALREELVGRLSTALGSTFVVRERSDGLELTNTLPPAFSRLGWSNVSRATLHVRGVGLARSEVAYELDLRPLRRRLGGIALVVVLAAGLPTLVLVGGLIWRLVIRSEHPAVRWQVFQTFQVAHALWPPFLVTSRLRANVRRAQASLHAIITAAGDSLSE